MKFDRCPCRHYVLEAGALPETISCHMTAPHKLAVFAESSPSVVADQRSLSQPRLTVGSPDHRISRKLSPVEIYYEMRTRRNSVTSSVRYLPQRCACRACLTVLMTIGARVFLCGASQPVQLVTQKRV